MPHRNLLIAFLCASLAVGEAAAAPFAEGFRKCEKCHEAEAEVWKGTAIRALRRNFVQGTLPEVCRSCTMYRSV